MSRRALIVFSVGAVAVMLLVSAWAWLQLPPGAEIPIHWGIEGAADAFAPAVIGLLLMPITVAFLAALLAVIPSIEPRRANLERSWTAYAVLWVGIVLLLAVIHLLIVAIALGAEIAIDRIVWTGAGVLFVLIGWYLPGVHSNFFFGVRTPWTLSSERSWRRTHRLAGRLFVAFGAVLVGLGLIDAPGDVTIVALLGGIVVILAVVMPYSYVVWRDDPDRDAPGSGTG